MLDEFLEWTQDAWWKTGIGILCLVVLILGVIFLISWIACGTEHGEAFSVKAHVREISYKPSATHTGTGYSTGADGKSGIIITTSTENESFNIVYQTDEGELITADDKEAYLKLKEGDKVLVWVQPMKWLGFNRSSQYAGFDKRN